MPEFNRKQKAIFLLGGGLKKDADGNWRTTNYDEPGDNFGVSGDRLRVVAATYLYKNDPEQIIIASGGKGQLKDIPDAPTVSQVIKKELIELGIPEDKIIEENNSGNTYDQLREAKRLAKETNFNKIGFLSNKWHLPRIKVMLESFVELKEIYNLAEVDFKDAEDTVLQYDRGTWQDIIESAFKSEGLKKRIELEEKGIMDIKTGKYKIK